MNRSNLIKSAVMGVLGTFMPRRAKAREKPSPTDIRPFEWRFEFSEPPVHVKDEFVDRPGWLFRAGTTVRCYYRNNLLVEAEMQVGSVCTLYGEFYHELYEKMRNNFSVQGVHYLYFMDVHFHAAVHYLAHEARKQKRLGSWPLADCVEFRDDPLGSLLYDIAVDDCDHSMCTVRSKKDIYYAITWPVLDLG